MITHATGPGPGIRGLAARPEARAGVVLIVLWMGTAIALQGSGQFGPMIAILVCASVVLWSQGGGLWFAVGQFVLWGALLSGTALILNDHERLPVMLALFGAAAAWFVLAEPLLRRRR